MEAWQAAERARGGAGRRAVPGVGRRHDLGGRLRPGPRRRPPSSSTAWPTAPSTGPSATAATSSSSTRPRSMEALRRRRSAPPSCARSQALQSIRVLARAVDAKDPLHPRATPSASPAWRRCSPRRCGWPRERAVAAARGGPRARRRQDRASPTRSSSSPGASTARGDGEGAGARGPRRRDALRRPRRRAGALGARPPRALGRRAATPTASPARTSPRARASSHLADAWDVMTSDRAYGAPARRRRGARRVPPAGGRPVLGRRGGRPRAAPPRRRARGRGAGARLGRPPARAVAWTPRLGGVPSRRLIVIATAACATCAAVVVKRRRSRAEQEAGGRRGRGVDGVLPGIGPALGRGARALSLLCAAEAPIRGT